MKPSLVVVACFALLAVIAPTPAIAAHVASPATSADPSVVPQTTARPGQPGYNIVASSQVHLATSSSTAGLPVFRGGRHSTAPGAVRSSTLAPSSPKISIFGGLNKPGLAGAGFGSTPPDSTGAIGPLDYVEMVNSRVAVYDRSLNLVSSNTLQAFTSQAAGVPLCDPQVQWDASATRWLYSILYCNTASSTQFVLVGWSKTSDPSNLSSAGWCQFGFNNTPYILDYDKLGHNSQFLIVGGNLYDETTPTITPPFLSAGIEWAQLPASNLDTSCTPPASAGSTMLGLKNGDGVTNTFTPVPVNTNTSAADGYIVSAYDPSGANNQTAGPRTKVAVWHLDSAGVLHADNDVVVNTYDVPSSAPQPGTSDALDTLDGRFTQAVGDPLAGIYTQHTVAGPGGRSRVDWYEFVLSGTTVVLAQQGSISDSTDWVFNAAISPRLDGRGAAVVYNRSSATTLPFIAARLRHVATPPGAMAAGELVIMSSAAADTDFSCTAPKGPPCRWGDYAGLTPDPVQTNLLWGTSEFNTAMGSAPAWADENFVIAPDIREPITQSSGGAPLGRTGVVQSTGAPTPPVR